MVSGRRGVLAGLRSILAGMWLAALISLLAWTAASPLPQRCLPPGRLIDVGGYRLHLSCTGARQSGKPTVILLHGLGDFSFDWALVQPEVARFTRVCSYDRAGGAWSDPGPLPRGPLKAAQELHTLLENAGEPRPYLLVGHSWGGLIVRVYASQYRTNVAGMVLVDSTHEDAFWEINDNIVVPRLLSDEEWAAVKPKERPATERPRAEVKLRPPFDRLPPEIQQLRLCVRSLPRLLYATTGGDLRDIRTDLVEVYSLAGGSRRNTLADLPLVVLSRAPDSRGPIPQERQEYNRQLQLELARASGKGKHVVGKTGAHHIQLSEPELVVSAIREVVAAASSTRPVQEAAGGPDVAELIRRVAENEKQFRAARDHYTYRQTFQFTEEGGGSYRAVTDVTFTPEGKRLEKQIKKPVSTLTRIQLTEEDFRDLVEVQPFVLDPEDLWNYEATYVAEQVLAGIPAYVLRIRPRQIFATQRLFAGTIWVSKDGLQIVQAEGKAVPDLVRKGRENLFPHFTTARERVDGAHWFPVLTYADDVLTFRSGPVRVRFTIKYENYKRFAAVVKIRYPK